MRNRMLRMMGVVIFVLSGVNIVFAECMSIEEFCRHYGDEICGRTLVAPDTPFPYWAGELDQVCPDLSLSDYRDNIAVVIVTWVTDRSDYKCGQLVRKRIGDLKDFTHRSISLRKCQ